jgi:P-type Cu+ transporter
MTATEKDPVCGMMVDPEKNPDLKVEHNGTTYWFCSRGCMLDFRDDPDVYLDPSYEPQGM